MGLETIFANSVFGLLTVNSTYQIIAVYPKWWRRHRTTLKIAYPNVAKNVMLSNTYFTELRLSRSYALNIPNGLLFRLEYPDHNLVISLIGA